jgi:dolichol-phosphate mannosyltransferase
LIIAITFSTGSILLMLGISGLYLGRIFEEVKRRPIFVIEEELNF